MGIEKQGAKPFGFTGKLIGRLMNAGHLSTYKKYFNQNPINDNSIILDIGCGGGGFIKYLTDQNSTIEVHGIDHSLEMVELSQNVNTIAIQNNKVHIKQGSVENLPYSPDTFNLITAFETVQFWSDIERVFTEIQKILKKDGEFLIINRYPAEGTKWWKLAQLKTEIDYTEKLKSAGFTIVEIDLKFKKPWIVVKASK